MYRLILVFLLLCLNTTVSAKDDAELLQLQGILNTINQEQQSVYQQFQMVLELRRINVQAQNAVPKKPPLIGGELPNYDAMVREQQAVQQQEQELTEQMHELYTRFNELGAEKKPVLARIQQIIASRASVEGSVPAARPSSPLPSNTTPLQPIAPNASLERQSPSGAPSTPLPSINRDIGIRPY